MQIPLHLHLIEIKFRFFYFFLSFAGCLAIIFHYHEAMFFFSTHSFSFINEGKFITTHITELFATYIYITLNLVTFLNFPYAYYHCKQFLSASWYKAQTWFFSNIQFFSFSIFFFSIFVCYFIILPSAYIFLDAWTITTMYAFRVQLEARIETYIWWTLQTTCLLSNLIYVFFVRITYFYLIDNMISLHIFYRKNKKYNLFLICLVTSTCVPPEIVAQLLFVFNTMLIFELFFFVTCLLFAKNNV
uniref:SecY-independent protein translocase component tatC n=1 Tax=Pyropia seriata TaxID=79731 RepID=UPI00286B9C25|nr:SecY-independent protein translocase component tatC [Neoporphyra seriata]WKD83598.1 SecY-independent protein translocase component tatC [Neoporphyra seriata]